MKKPVFRQAMSLGHDCQVIHQLRRKFGRYHCPSGIFDYQVTPTKTLLEYLERDFRGMFERADLDVDAREIVINTRYRTRHLHEFPKGLREDYESAKSRHDYLCDKIRSVIDGVTPTLFGLRYSPSDFPLVSEVRSILSKRNPRLLFDIVMTSVGTPPTRPPPGHWMGNDEEWSNALSEFRVRPTVYMQTQIQMKRFVSHLTQ
jgi:hypothetical protein